MGQARTIGAAFGIPDRNERRMDTLQRTQEERITPLIDAWWVHSSNATRNSSKRTQEGPSRNLPGNSSGRRTRKPIHRRFGSAQRRGSSAYLLYALRRYGSRAAAIEIWGSLKGKRRFKKGLGLAWGQVARRTQSVRSSVSAKQRPGLVLRAPENQGLLGCHGQDPHRASLMAGSVSPSCKRPTSSRLKEWSGGIGRGSRS